MDQEAAAADLVGERGDPSDDIHQEPSAESLAFVCEIDAEPGKQGNWLGIPSGTRSQSLRSIADRKLPHAPGVVRDDPI
ncbi:hypothetical protein GCM10027062_20180 [Nocardioides hungaricus]